MNDLVREIQEDIQRERWLALWERFGRIIIMLAVALVLTVAGYQGWKAYKHSQAEAYTTEILAAVRNPDAEAFANAAKQTEGAHAGIARLVQAQLLLADGKRSEAEGVLKALAAQGDDMPSDLARALIVDAKSLDKSSSRFRATALERSGWAAIEQKDYDAATKAFNSLQQMEHAPESMKERAKSALAFIQAQDSPKPKE